LFTGAEVDGDSGFVNLMRIKRDYFRAIRGELLAQIDARAKKHTAFREELFDKLHTFFGRHFCESGSIYFRHLPAFAKTYERVYADGEDVALAWKTRMLYYVKSDVLVRSMPVELNEEGAPHNTRRFYFDAAAVEHKKNNERREFIFAFDQVAQEKHGRVVRIKVAYSTGGVKTKSDDIIKLARKGGVKLTDEQLQKALGVFRRQTEADFFINKDARGFLREQFDLWMYQYIFAGVSVFEAERVRQLQAIRDTAYDIIDFIAQFENELRGAWEKPKFARGVNYVVTLDRLADATLNKLAKHKGVEAQVAEWRDLGLVGDDFSIKTPARGQRKIGGKNAANGDHQFLPLDTKHFKDLELDILDDLGDLDAALDGELVHSENWQALNTLQKRYAGKVKCIYIDPPFNLDGSDQFDYRTNYKDSCWATMLENRIELGRSFLLNDGAMFVRCDHNGNKIVRFLMDKTFGRENFQNELIVNRFQKKSNAFTATTESVFLYFMSDDTRICAPTKQRACIYCHAELEPKWNWAHSAGASDKPRYFSVDGKRTLLYPPKGRHWTNKQETIDELTQQNRMRINHSMSYTDSNGRKIDFQPEKLQSDSVVVDGNWTDIRGYEFGVYSEYKFSTENAEELLERIVNSASNADDVVVDFFSGSATTQAVAQKLGRKWLGVEMGEHFHTVILPRMKKTLGGNQTGISREVDYKGGGAFKYYALEQYEETLRNAHYAGGVQVELDSAKSPFAQYVFFADDKLAGIAQPKSGRGKNAGKLEIPLQNLYADLDIAESLSNILGKPIRRLTADSVTFADGAAEKTDPARMTEAEKQHFIEMIRPYLWWGE